MHGEPEVSANQRPDNITDSPTPHSRFGGDVGGRACGVRTLAGLLPPIPPPSGPRRCGSGGCRSALSIPILSVMRAFLAAANDAFAKRPMAAAMLTAGFKGMAVDSFVQKVVEGKESLDVRRTLVFTAHGLLYVGGAQYMIFTHGFPRLIPGLAPAGGVSPTMGAAMTAAALDTMVHVPFVYMPIFYAIRGVADRTQEPANILSTAYRDYTTNWATDTQLGVAIFLPFQIANFTYNPRHLRVPALVAMGVLWIGVLSFLRGDRSKQLAYDAGDATRVTGTLHTK